MLLQQYREDFYVYSGKASDLTRQLAFAGIALIWLFKRDIAAEPVIPAQLILPGLLIVLALTADMLHYVVASFVWRHYYLKQEKNNVSETDLLNHSVWLERPIYFLYLTKIMLIMFAYGFLLRFLFQRLVW